MRRIQELENDLARAGTIINEMSGRERTRSARLDGLERELGAVERRVAELRKEMRILLADEGVRWNEIFVVSADS